MYVQCTDFENLNLKMHIVIPFILIGYFRRMNIIQTTESFVEKLSSDQYKLPRRHFIAHNKQFLPQESLIETVFSNVQHRFHL